MRILTAALLCFIIASASYSSTVATIIFGKSGLPDYSLILILLSTYLMLEGIYAIEKERQQQSEQLRDDARRHLRSYEKAENAKNQDDSENEKLKLALRDAETKLNELRRDAEKGGTNINAEIVNFLGILQEQGRLVDFLMDDITAYDDAQVGSAARVVHQGCRELLDQYFEIAPVFEGNEGSSTELGDDFSTQMYRIVGTSGGQPPYKGTVVHRGWRTAKVNIPKVSASLTSGEPLDIIAPAQVEVD
ncbi:MAG: DUF2760 domain-containing protein [Bdellovibrionales bacterium]|nr:DUF2760 domain-containing protein [Bdellovibrionales bacterium]